MHVQTQMFVLLSVSTVFQAWVILSWHVLALCKRIQLLRCETDIWDQIIAVPEVLEVDDLMGGGGSRKVGYQKRCISEVHKPLISIVKFMLAV
jgi:hypothetical protein